VGVGAPGSGAGAPAACLGGVRDRASPELLCSWQRHRRDWEELDFKVHWYVQRCERERGGGHAREERQSAATLPRATAATAPMRRRRRLASIALRATGGAEGPRRFGAGELDGQDQRLDRQWYGNQTAEK
jgi:hypothetical protein